MASVTRSLKMKPAVVRHWQTRHFFEGIAVLLIIVLATFSLWPSYVGHSTKSLDGGKLDYRGRIAAEKFDGQGSLRINNQDRYTGQFVDGRFSGTGTFVSHQGWQYRGEFKAGKMVGTGKMIENHQIIATLKNGELIEK